jgi:hypothetical protein
MSGRALRVALVLAAVAMAAWLSVRTRPAASEGRVLRQALFASGEIPVEQVDRLELERPGAPTLVFARDADGWAQTMPFAHPADAAALRMVIDALASLESTRAVDPATLDPEARMALGLDPARARVTVAWPGGTRTVVLGRRTVAGRAWARVDGRAEAASVDSGLHAVALEDDPRQWRSSRLHDAASADVARLELRYGPAPGQQLVIARTGGAWRSEAPFATRIDAEAVRGYLDALLRAEADAFVADEPKDLAAFGPASPERSVRLLASGGDSPQVGLVEVGVPAAEGAQERFGRIDGRPAVVQLGPRALAALFPPPAFFIDPRGCAAVPADVRRIEFTPPNGGTSPTWTLERSASAARPTPSRPTAIASGACSRSSARHARPRSRSSRPRRSSCSAPSASSAPAASRSPRCASPASRRGSGRSTASMACCASTRPGSTSRPTRPSTPGTGRATRGRRRGARSTRGRAVRACPRRAVPRPVGRRRRARAPP